MKSPKNHTLGILFSTLNGFALAITVKCISIVTIYMHKFLALFLDKAIGLTLIAIWIICSSRTKHLSCKKMHYHIIRSFFSVLGAALLFSAAKHVNVAEITAILSLGPVITTFIGAFLFGETMSLKKVAAIFISFLGMLYIFYPPDADTIYVPSILLLRFETPENRYVGLLLLCCLSWVVNSLVVKKISYTDNSCNQLFFNLVYGTIFSGMLLISATSETGIDNLYNNYDASGLYVFILICCASICYLIHCIVRFLAYKVSDLSVVMPFSYTKAVFGAVIGYYIDGNPIANSSIMGSGLILLGGMILTVPFHKLTFTTSRSGRKKAE